MGEEVRLKTRLLQPNQPPPKSHLGATASFCPLQKQLGPPVPFQCSAWVQNYPFAGSSPSCLTSQSPGWLPWLAIPQPVPGPIRPAHRPDLAMGNLIRLLSGLSPSGLMGAQGPCVPGGRGNKEPNRIRFSRLRTAVFALPLKYSTESLTGSEPSQRRRGAGKTRAVQ